MTTETEDQEIETQITDDDDDVIDPNADRGDTFVQPEESGVVALDPVALDEIAGQAGEADGEPESGKHGQMIPKARFDEVNNARKSFETENARLLAEIEALRHGDVKSAPVAETGEPATTPEINELERKRIDAMMDGDIDEAARIGVQITEMVRAQAKAEALREIDERDTRATDEQRINSAAESVIGQYPEFDDKGDKANQEAIAELVEMRDFYIHTKGMHPADAIAKAAERVAKVYGFGVAETSKPNVDPRMRGAIERGAAVSESQPRTAAVGVGTRQDATKVRIEDMDEDQFDALPESEKRRLRGD